MGKLGKWSFLVGSSFLALTGTISCSNPLQEQTKEVESQTKQQDVSDDPTPEPAKKTAPKEEIPKVVKSPEEQELDAFEAEWLYRPAKPLVAYPKLDKNIFNILKNYGDEFNESIGNQKFDYSYFTKDNKQKIYKDNEPQELTSAPLYGEFIIAIDFHPPIFAIYYEIYDFAHDREVENNIEGKKRGITESHNWDYLDPYNV